MNWYLAAFRKYAEFPGRARRQEYWMFTLINLLISIALFIVGLRSGALAVVSGLYALAAFIPGLAVGVRRLHDTGRSGWMMLLSLIPIVGGIVLLVFLCQDSAPGDNRYGSNPKTPAVEAMPA